MVSELNKAQSLIDSSNPWLSTLQNLLKLAPGLLAGSSVMGQLTAIPPAMAQIRATLVSVLASMTYSISRYSLAMLPHRSNISICQNELSGRFYGRFIFTCLPVIMFCWQHPNYPQLYHQVGERNHGPDQKSRI